MKAKIIRAFLAIYLALSLIYGGVRAAYLTVRAALAPAGTEVVEEQTLSAPTFGTAPPPTPEREQEVLPAPSISKEDDPGEEPEALPPEATPEPFLPEETAAPEETVEPIEAVAPEETVIPEDTVEPIETDAPEETAAPEESPETWAETPEAEEDREDRLEAAPAEDVPSLEEYLSGLICGRCGRRCPLSNPHCRTGRSKAEKETAAYYELYGEAVEGL